ncbi:hypothetical protein DM02DRAFT_510889 [Periconia macrospinosa]|uniref:Cellular morphogenesis protein n=1 Tax=Periconia macrospinosa TaxID=97972 RepID=A0A2V1ECH7_9PLEO|nr:hypothetical protein DM02DRAFT_510889 [Periconia macrospinosa]
MLASRAGKLALSLLLTSSYIIPGSNAFTLTPVPLPQLDLSRLGRVAFAGDFDSLSLFQYAEQNETSDPASAIYQRLPTGTFAPIKNPDTKQALNTDGDVKAMCAFLRNDNLQGYVVGGNFTSVDGVKTPGGIAMLDPNTGKPTALQGLTGSVNALFCDASRGQVYVGGEFTGGSSKNAIIWKEDWTNMPFEGFNGPVNSIAQSPNGNIVFGGEFDGLGNGTSGGAAQNNTQSLPVGSANITAQTSSGQPGFTDPKTIACKSNPEAEGADSTWLLADSTPGFWRADFGFGFQPTKLRLYNTKIQGRGTKTWRYTALPDGGIMNFTFVDPTTKQQAYCDARCPLPEGNTTAQDFFFVNQVGMNGFRVDISDWYGQGGGLNAIEVYQTQIFSYAIDEFNKPSCGGKTSGASASRTGTWNPSPSHDSSSMYLTATLPIGQINPDQQSVTFRPDIPQTGNYSIKLYTPGCRGDNTCTTRGQVSISIEVPTGSGSIFRENKTLFQTNEFDKYDSIYDGFIDPANGQVPTVKLSPLLQPNPSGSNDLTIVAQRVSFDIKNATSGDINGLFEYDANQQVVDTDLSKSVIVAAGSSLSPSQRANVKILTTTNNRLYIGGNFTSGKGFNHIFAVGRDDKEPTTLDGNGLNDQVNIIYGMGNKVYVGGKFTNTQNNGASGLNGLAAYNANNKWEALGAGVNGFVLHIVPFTMNITGTTEEDVLGISGYFDRVNGFGSNAAFPVDNFAIWVPSQNNWLPNLNLQTTLITGHVTAFADIPKGDAPMNRIYSGTISSGTLAANGAAALNHDNDVLSLRGLATNIREQPQTVSRKRSLSDNHNLNTTGIVTATFYKGNNMNKTILGGHFATTGSNGQNITNVAIIDGKDSDKISGFGEQVDFNSTVATLSVWENILYAGGRLTGRVNNNRLAGIVAYDLATNNFGNTQPPALLGTNVTVNAIAPRPNSRDVYVAGRFESAGALSCPALCIWNTERNQWLPPGSSVTGVATSLTWIADTKLLVAGNLTVGGNSTKIFTYDSTTSQFEPLPGAADLPGPVTALTAANREATEYWAAGQASDGSAFLQRYRDGKWLPVRDQFQSGTNIRSIQPLTIRDEHGNSDVIDRGEVLLILGEIQLRNSVSASGAIYNGSAVTPFLLTSGPDQSRGSLSQMFVENPDSFFDPRGKKLALGFIVLIALAIALALTFLLVVAGILLEWYRKKSQGYSPAPTSYTDRMGNVGRVPPEQLFGTLSGPRAPAI